MSLPGLSSCSTGAAAAALPQQDAAPGASMDGDGDTHVQHCQQPQERASAPSQMTARCPGVSKQPPQHRQPASGPLEVSEHAAQQPSCRLSVDNPVSSLDRAAFGSLTPLPPPPSGAKRQGGALGPEGAYVHLNRSMGGALSTLEEDSATWGTVGLAGTFDLLQIGGSNDACPALPRNGRSSGFSIGDGGINSGGSIDLGIMSPSDRTPDTPGMFAAHRLRSTLQLHDPAAAGSSSAGPPSFAPAGPLQGPERPVSLARPYASSALAATQDLLDQGGAAPPRRPGAWLSPQREGSWGAPKVPQHFTDGVAAGSTGGSSWPGAAGRAGGPWPGQVGQQRPLPLLFPLGTNQQQQVQQQQRQEGSRESDGLPHEQVLCMVQSPSDKVGANGWGVVEYSRPYMGG